MSTPLSTRLLALLLCVLLALPSPLVFAGTARADDNDALVHARLNSPQRAKTLEDAARQSANSPAHSPADFPAPSAAGKKTVLPSHAEPSTTRKAATPNPVPPPSLKTSVPRQTSLSPLAPKAPQPARPGALPGTLPEVLVNTAAGLAGLPGVGPQPTRASSTHGAQFLVPPTARGRSAANVFSPLMPGTPRSPVSDSSLSFSGNGINYGLGLAHGVGQAAAQNLGGNLRFQFSADQDGRLQGEGDFLLPLFDSTHTTVFTQMGLRSMWDERWIGNIGIGQRWYPSARGQAAREQDAREQDDTGGWMLGYNAFFDYDLSRAHQRGGLGVEVGHGGFRLSSNYYVPLSGWRNARGKAEDMAYYLERPAEGWDIRVRGQLPFFPRVTLTGAYAQWRGEEVGVFGSSQREKNPAVWSYGLEYAPVPLLTLIAEQQRTESGRADTRLGLRFSYQFGTPLSDSLKPTMIRDADAMNRRDFVDRENRIILEYKKKDFSIALSGYEFSVPSGGMLHIGLTASSAAPLSMVSWEGSAAPFLVGSEAGGGGLSTGGDFRQGGDFRLPAWQADAGNVYHIRAVARNTAGQTAASPTATITVLPSGSYTLSLSAASMTVAVGDSVELTAVLSATGQGAAAQRGRAAHDPQSGQSGAASLNPVGNQTIFWRVTSGASSGRLDAAQSVTNASGRALNTFVASQPGPVEIVAELDGRTAARVTLTVIPVRPRHVLQLQADAPDVAVGSNLGLTATLTSDGAPVADAEIDWAIVAPADGAGTLSLTQSVTDSAGRARDMLTATGPGLLTVRASWHDDPGVSSQTTITVTAASRYVLDLTPPAALVSGGSGVIVATLTDDGQPVSGASVVWSIVSGAGRLLAGSSDTGGDGRAQVVFLAERSGPVVVQAEWQGVTRQITFTVGAAYGLALSAASPDVTNGSGVALTATLTDNGQPVNGRNIVWTVSGTGVKPGNGSLSASSSVTAGDGRATTILTASASGTVTVTVSLADDGGVSAAAAVNISPSYSLTLTPASTTIANGGAAVFTATLLDNGAAVSGQNIVWSLTGPGSIGSASLTDGNGHASSTYTATQSGTATVTATFTASGSAGVSGGTLTAQASVVIDPRYSLSVAAAPAVVSNGGLTTLTATLLDNGTPTEGETVNWSIVSGAGGGNGDGVLSASSSATSGGQASVTFTASRSGTVVLQASFGSLGSLTSQISVTVTPAYALTINPPSANVGNGSSQTFVATLTDNGTPVSGARINWNVASGAGDGVLSVVGDVTDVNGETSATFRATRSGALGLTASLAGSLSARSEITVLPSLSLSLSPFSASISNGAATGLKAVLLDNGSPVSGENIVWSIVGGTGSLSTSSSATDGNGEAHATLTATQSGTIVVQAESASLSVQTTVNVTPVYSLTLSPSSVGIRNGDSPVFTATLTDNGVPVSGARLDWTVAGGADGGDGSLSAASSSTDAGGRASVTFTATRSGSAVVRVTLNSGGPLSGEATVNIIPAYALSLSVDQPVVSVSGGSTLVTATLTDNGAPVSGQVIAWSMDSGSGAGDGTLSPASSSTNANGQATTVFTATQSGTATVRANLGSLGALTQTVTISVTPSYTLAVSPAAVTVSRGDSTTFTATLLNNGMPVSGESVSWALSSGTGGGGGGGGNGQLSASTGPTDANGQTSIVFTGTQDGPATLQAAFGTLTSTASITVAPSYSLNVSAAASVANGGDVTITATLLNGGVPVAGELVDWSLVAGSNGGTLSATSSATDADGHATVTLTATQSGTVTVQTSFAGLPAQTTVTVTPVYALTLSPLSPVVSNGRTQVFTATLTDNGTPAAGQSIVWGVTPAGGGEGTLSASSSATDAAGNAAVTLTAARSGTLTLTAALATNSAVRVQTTVTVTPVYALTLSPLSPSVSNGGSTTFTATLTDNGTPVSGAAIGWSVTGGSPGNGTLSAASSSTNASGQATVTFNATQSGTVLVEATGEGLTASAPLTITPAYSLVLSPLGSSVSNGGVQTFTATLTDNGVPVSGAVIDWSVTGGGGTLSAASSATDAGGQAVSAFTASQSGSATVRAAFMGLTASAALTIHPSYSLQIAPASSSVSNGGSVALTATLLDGGNPVNGADVSWSVSSTGGTGGGSLTAVTTTMDGLAVNTFAATQSGSVVVTATFGSASAQASITIHPVYSLVADATPDSIVNGADAALTATLLDNGAPVQGATVVWTVIAGAGLLAPTSSVTDASGHASTTLTATQSGTLTAQAAFGSLTAQTSLVVTPSYRLTVAPLSQTIANGGGATLTATLTDNGVPVEGQTIGWNVVDGTGAGSVTPTSVTNRDGEAVAAFAATATGTAGIQAVFGSLTARSDVTVMPVYALAFDASAPSLPNGGSRIFTVTLTDNGVPVAGATIDWSLDSGADKATLDSPSSRTNAAGQASVTLSASKSGMVTLRATLSGGGVFTQSVATITPAYSLNVSAASMDVGNGETTALTAVLLDNGTPVPSENIVWSVVGGTGGASLSPLTSTTDAAGQAVSVLTATQSGTLTAQAAFGSLTAQVTLVVSPRYRLVNLAASPSVIANGGGTDLSVTLYDGNNAVPNAAITWSVVGGNGYGTLPLSSVTDGGGRASAAFVATQSGTVTVQAAFGAVTLTTGITVNPAYRLNLGAAAGSIVNGGATALTAELLDNNTPVSGQTINWSVSGASLSAASSVTNAAGLATVNLTASQSGQATVTAVLASDSAIQAQTVVTIVPAYHLSINPAAATVTNGGDTTLTVTLLDGLQPVNGATINWNVAAGTGNGTLSAASSVTNAAGQASITFNSTDSGTAAVVAAYDSQTAQAEIVIDAHYGLSVAASPGTISNGGTATLTATLLDLGVPVDNEAIVWSIDGPVGGSGGGSLSPASSVTNAQGQASTVLTATQSGTVTVRATFGALTATTTLVVTPVYRLDLAPASASIANGGSAIFAATLTDNGAPVAGQTIVWHGVGGNVAASSVTDVAGVARVTFTANASGAGSLQAVYGALTASSVITVTPVYALRLEPVAASLTNGHSQTFTATLTDNGAAVSGAQINWSVTAGTGDGTPSAASSSTNGGGQATVTFTAAQSGLLTLTATLAAQPSLFVSVPVVVSPSYTLSVSASSGTVSNGGTAMLTATLLDNGVPVSGRVVTWSASGMGNGTLSPASSPTNASGQATATFTATQSGAVLLEAASEGLTATTPLIVIPSYSLTVTADSAAISNGGGTTLTATLLDNGTPVDNATITWSVAGGTGNGLLAPTSVTNGQGRAFTSFTATQSGTVSVQASYGSLTALTSITISPVYTLDVSAIPAAIFNGGSTALTAVLRDNGTPVSGSGIVWSVVGGSPGNGFLSSPNSLTDGGGAATNTFTANQSGTVTIRAALTSDSAVSGQAQVTINPAYSLRVTPSAANVANGGTQIFTATLTDNGTAVSGAVIDWSVAGGTGDGTLSAASSSTNGSGQATVTFTAARSGTAVMTAAMGSVTDLASVTITPSYTLNVVASSGSISNGGGTTLTATLMDGGNPVSGAPIVWSVAGGTGGGSILPVSSVTNGSGQATATLTANRSGTVIAQASFGLTTAQTTVTVTPVYNLVLSPLSPSMSNGGTQTFTATLTDNGTAVNGAVIDWSVTAGSPGNGTLSAASSSTNASGQATTILTATQSGTLTFKATLATNSAVNVQTIVTVTPSYTLSVSASPASVSNGGNTTLTATLLDNGVAVSGVPIVWSVAGGTGGGTILPVTSSTNSSGQATATLTANKSGTVIAQASFGLTTGQTTVTVTPVYSLSVSASPASVSNGGDTTLTATLLDNGVAVSGVPIVWSVAGGTGGGTILPVTSSTNASGQATATLTANKRGTVIAQATFGLTTAQTTVTVTPVYSLSVSASPASVSNGGDTTLTATLLDNGVAVSGVPIVWSVAGGTGGGTILPVTSSTNGNGQATATLTANKSGTVIAQATFGLTTAQTTVTVTPVYNLVLSPLSPSVSNGGTQTFTATLTDNGAAVSGAQINWSVTAGTGNGTLSTASSSTNGGGQTTTILTATQSGTLTLKATLATNSAVNVQTTVTVTPAYNLVLSPLSPSVSNGGTQTFTATLTDNGTAVNGAVIDWSVTAGSPGNGTLSAASSSTNGGGQTTTILTATQSGTLTLKATLATNSAVNVQTTVTVTPAYTLNVSASPASVSNGGSSTLTATLLDNGVAVSGVPIVWSVAGGTGGGAILPLSSTTNASGQATATLTANKSGTVIAQATFGLTTGQTTVTVTPVYSLVLSPLSPSVSNGGTQTFTATLTDNGTAVSGAQINWSVTAGSPGNGTLSTASSSTNGGGQTTTVLTATQSGTLTFKATLATNSAVTVQTTVTVTPVYNLLLSPLSPSVSNGGTQAFTATLTDNGTAVSGAQINWSVTAGSPGNGTLSAANSSTNASGQATTILTATQSGTLTLKATLATNSAVTVQTTVTVTPVYNLTLSPLSPSVSNGGTQTFTVTLTDNGTAVSGAQINWSVTAGSPGNGTLSATSSSTNGGGQATTILTATQSGTLTFKATLATNSAVTVQTTVTVTPAYTLNVSASPASVSNGGNTTLTATLLDNGVAVSGVPIVWSVAGGTGGGTILPVTSSTNASGQATATLSTNKSGTVIAQASFGLTTAQTTVTVTPVYNIVLSPLSPSVSNGGTQTFTATLTDNGTAVSGAQINWSVTAGSPGNGTLSAASSATNGGGQATTVLTATQSGTLTFKATLATNSAVNVQTTVTVTPSYTLNVSASPASVSNGGNTTLTATLLDNGVAVSGVPIVWSVAGGTGGGTILPVTSSTNASGQATATFTANKSGTVIAQATFGLTTGQTTVTVTPVYSIVLSPLTPSVSNGSTQAFTATLTDNGTAVSGAQINWSVTAGSPGNGTLSAASSATNGGGQATTVLTATQSGTLTFKATLATNSAVNVQTTVTVTPAYTLNVSASPASVSNGGSSTLTATLLDNGVAVNGVPIVWSVAGGTGGGTILPVTLSTNASGQATATLTANKSGTVIAQATFGLTTAQTTVTVTPVYSIVLSPLTPSVSNGGTQAFTATLTDNGTAVNGAVINWSVTAGSPGNGTLSAANSSTNASGQATTVLTATQSGTLTFKATLATNSAVTVQTTVTVTPSYNLVLSPLNPSVSNGGTQTFTATLTDNGTAVSGAQINWSVTAGSPGNGTLSAASSSTNGGGQATTVLTATQSGTLTFKATLATNSAVNVQTTVTVTPSYTLNVSASPASVSNGGSSTLTATLLDNGVAVNGVPIVWSVAGGTGGGTILPVTSSTNASGQATATLTANKSGTVIAQATFGLTTGQTTVTVTPVYNLTLSPLSPSVSNGGTQTFTATLTDNGTAVSGAQINWSVTAGSPGNGTLSAANSSTNASGQATTILTATQSGTLTLKATLATNSAVNVQTTVTVTPSYTLNVSASPASVSNGGSTTLTATLLDNGVAVSGVPIVWSVAGGTGGGAILPLSSTTNASGQATATLTANKSGTVIAQATFGLTTGQTTVTVTPVYNIVLSPLTPSVSNGSTQTFTATLTDNGTAVSGAQINWSVTAGSPGNGTLSAASSTTNASGQATTVLTATQSGTLTFKATLATNSAVTVQTTVTVTPVYSLTLSPNNLLSVKIGQATTFTATLTDAGAPVQGATINWSVSGLGLASMSPASSVTNASGQAASNLSPLALGIISITAKLSTNSSVTVSTSSISIGL